MIPISDVQIIDINDFKWEIILIEDSRVEVRYRMNAMKN